jgi:hypothetical protein
LTPPWPQNHRTWLASHYNVVKPIIGKTGSISHRTKSVAGGPEPVLSPPDGYEIENRLQSQKMSSTS